MGNKIYFLIYPRINEKLANNTDIVYVGFNYRLHAFGFMALQMLADNSSTGTSGNYGFMDMISVLQWVQTNIQNFGGNPNQVGKISYKKYKTSAYLQAISITIKTYVN